MIDREVLSRVQALLLEPVDGGATCSTPLWTPGEWLGSLNARQRRFLEQSGLVVEATVLPATAGSGVIALAETVALVVRVAWQTRAGVVTGLPVISLTEADLVRSRWPTERATPRYAVLAMVPSRQLRLVPPPDDAGQVHVLAVTTGATVDGAGTTLTVPDDWVEYLHWGVVADALLKTGPARDPARGAYAEARVEEGVTLARLLLDELASGVDAGAGGFS